MVTPPWQTQILHNSRLHAIPHMNSQWHSQINTKTNKPWSKVLPEKLIVPQLVKKFPTFYGNQWFATTFTSTCHLSLSSTWSIHACPSHFLNTHFNIFHHVYLGFLNSPFPSGLSTNILRAPLLSPIHPTCSSCPVLLYKIQRSLKNISCQLNFSIVMWQHVAW